jgi:hypothetical protein
MVLNNLNNIDINELLKNIRDKQDKQNARQRANYLKRKEEGRNKQLKPKEEHKKRGPKAKKQLNITSINNLSLLLSTIEKHQIPEKTELETINEIIE